MFVSNFKILSAEVGENSLTGKITHRHKHIVTEKTKLYTCTSYTCTSYAGGIMIVMIKPITKYNF